MSGTLQRALYGLDKHMFQPITCPICSTSNRATAKICEQCGAATESSGNMDYDHTVFDMTIWQLP